LFRTKRPKPQTGLSWSGWKKSASSVVS